MFSSAKSAPSKFTLNKPAYGGRHFTALAICGSLAWVGRSWWYSWSALQAMELIFYIGIASSSKQSLFLRSQISEVVQANKSKQDLFCCASWITFKKLEHELEAATKSANNTCQTVDNKGHVHRACNMSSSPSLHWGANSLDFFKENFNIWYPFFMIILYHQTKTPISFWCKWGLNLISFIQPSEILPIELTEIQTFLVHFIQDFSRFVLL